MQRDMSYDLDDVFSGRNAGELISEPVVKTRVLRTPGLRVLEGPQTKSLDPALDRSLSIATGIPLDQGMYTKAGDLAGDINIPVIGPVSVTQLAVGAAIGAGIWYFFLRR